MEVRTAFLNFPLSVKMKNNSRYTDPVTPFQFSSAEIARCKWGLKYHHAPAPMRPRRLSTPPPLCLIYWSNNLRTRFCPDVGLVGQWQWREAAGHVDRPMPKKCMTRGWPGESCVRQRHRDEPAIIDKALSLPRSFRRCRTAAENDRSPSNLLVAGGSRHRWLASFEAVFSLTRCGLSTPDKK